MTNYLLEAYKRYLTESVTPNQIMDAIRNHERILINYKTEGEDRNNGSRVIEVYAYGLTRKGNPVIRAFQNYGDTTRRGSVPTWKFFRLDRIISWKPTGQTFKIPANKRYRNMPPFNTMGDKTMSNVYMVAKFDDTNMAGTNKQNFDDLKNQLDNPIYIDQIIDKNGFVGAKERTNYTGGEQSDDYIKGQRNLDKTKDYYGGDISSKFNSNASIKQRLGYNPDEPEDEEMRKRIEMEKDWMAMEKQTARKNDKYYNDETMYDNDFSTDNNGSKAMKKLSSLGNLRRGTDYDRIKVPKMNQDLF